MFLSVLHVAKTILYIVRGAVKGLFKEIVKRLNDWGETARLILQDWGVLIKYVISKAIIEHPLVQSMKSFIQLFTGGPSSPPSKPGLLSKAARFLGLPPVPSKPELPDTAQIERELGGKPLDIKVATIKELAAKIPLGTLLTVPASENVPTFLELEAQLSTPKVGEPFILSKEAKRVLERTRHPTRIFTAERRDLIAKAGGTVSRPLEGLHEEEKRYRSMIFAVVHKVLMPQIAPHVAKLAGLFQTLDESLYDYPKPKSKSKSEAETVTDFPVLELEESSRLLPVIGKLRIQVVHLDESEAKAWGDAFKEALKTQSYLLPATF